VREKQLGFHISGFRAGISNPSANASRLIKKYSDEINKRGIKNSSYTAEQEQLFIDMYGEGETAGNAAQSAIKAGIEVNSTSKGWDLKEKYSEENKKRGIKKPTKPKKSNKLKENAFIDMYGEGETAGNVSQSAIKTGFTAYQGQNLLKKQAKDIQKRGIKKHFRRTEQKQEQWFINYYGEGETAGKLSKAFLKAGYKARPKAASAL
jgi:hypothetical protein